jgi:hypothetical protein
MYIASVNALGSKYIFHLTLIFFQKTIRSVLKTDPW